MLAGILSRREMEREGLKAEKVFLQAERAYKRDLRALKVSLNPMKWTEPETEEDISFLF